MATSKTAVKTRSNKIKKHWQLYLILFIPTILIIVFSYVPMFGIVMAFQNYMPTRGVFGSEWVGFDNFLSFFKTRQFTRLVSNTFGLSLYALIAGFPIPIILAMALHQCQNLRFKKTVQMITYLPHFISVVVVVSMINLLFSQKSGLVNNLLDSVFGVRFNFTGKPDYFKTLYVFSGVWQNMGFNSILYLAALAGIDPTQHEAATIDGATRWQRIWHVDFPGILPTIVVMLILNTGTIMSVGYEKVLLMQNNLNMSASDVISTYTYRIGLLNAQYGLSTAVSLLNSVINMTLLVTVNQISRKIGDSSLW